MGATTDSQVSHNSTCGNEDLQNPIPQMVVLKMKVVSFYFNWQHIFRISILYAFANIPEPTLQYRRVVDVHVVVQATIQDTVDFLVVND